MLRTKSFKITDYDGINELLATYRLAAGAHILVSEGQVLIPYEDGAALTKSQHIVQIREQQNTLRAQKEIIEHSNRVLAQQIADASAAVEYATVQMDGVKSKQEHHDWADKRRVAEGKVSQLSSQKLMNEEDIKRLQINLDLYDEQVKAIEAE